MRMLRPFQPAAALIALAVALIVGIAIVRGISGGAGFLVERQIVFVAWLGGLLIGSAVFAWVVQRAMRRDASRLGLLVMALTVLVLASPLTLMLLQHPAP